MNGEDPSFTEPGHVPLDCLGKPGMSTIETETMPNSQTTEAESERVNSSETSFTSCAPVSEKSTDVNQPEWPLQQATGAHIFRQQSGREEFITHNGQSTMELKDQTTGMPWKIRIYGLGQRQCCHFCPSPSASNMCACGQDESWHDERNIRKSQSEFFWSKDTHTELSPSATFGTIRFPGEPDINNYVIVHPYIRIDYRTKAEKLRWLTSKEVVPRLVINVIAGQALNSDPQFSISRFKRSLVEAAVNLDALIVTRSDGCISSDILGVWGTMPGDDKNLLKNNHVVNVSHWGSISNSDVFNCGDEDRCPVVYDTRTTTHMRTQGQVALQQNNVSFLFIDDGTKGKSDAVDEFCLGLMNCSEDTLEKTFSILLIVGGDESTLETAKAYINRGHPILAIGGSTEFVNSLTNIKKQFLINILEPSFTADMQHILFTVITKYDRHNPYDLLNVSSWLAFCTYTSASANGWLPEDLNEALFLAFQSGYGPEVKHLQDNGISIKFLTKRWLDEKKYDVSWLYTMMFRSHNLDNLRHDCKTHLLRQAVTVAMMTSLTVTSLWRLFYCCWNLDALAK